MTYQEIIDNIRNNTLSFILEKSKEHSIDASIVMQIMTEVVTEINYNTIIKALYDQRDINNTLTAKLQTLQAEQPSGDN